MCVELETVPSYTVFITVAALLRSWVGIGSVAPAALVESSTAHLTEFAGLLTTCAW